jgi:hypothetical protein
MSLDRHLFFLLRRGKGAKVYHGCPGRYRLPWAHRRAYTGTMAMHVGTSGWVSHHWRGSFELPPLRPREWLHDDASACSTVAITNAFNRLPADATCDAWRAQAPTGLLDAVQASRSLTHLTKLADPEVPLHRFCERTRRLGHPRGPVLYPLPSRWPVHLPRCELAAGADLVEHAQTRRKLLDGATPAPCGGGSGAHPTRSHAATRPSVVRPGMHAACLCTRRGRARTQYRNACCTRTAPVQGPPQA